MEYTRAFASPVASLNQFVNNFFTRLASRRKSTARIQGGKLLKIFDQYDVDRLGFIDREELSKALTRLKVCPLDADISDFMKAADKDESGHLSFAEFSSTFTKAQLSSVFRSSMSMEAGKSMSESCIQRCKS